MLTNILQPVWNFVKVNLALQGHPSLTTSPDTGILLPVLSLTSPPHDHHSLPTFARGTNCREIVQGCANSDDTLERWIDCIEGSGGGADEELNIVLCCIIAWFDALPVDHDPGDMRLRRLRRTMFKLSLPYQAFPSTLFREGVMYGDPLFRAGGAFGEVSRGMLGNESVALKRLRAIQPTDTIGSRKSLYREALLWRLLHHPSILPFLGLRRGTDEMISPWMENGDLTGYIQKHAGTIDSHLKCIWILQIASGLAYLHDSGVVHGDLHGGNIFLDEHAHVHIADFGLATLIDAGQITMGNSAGGLGAVRWMAPERLEPGARCTPEADVYSFACLCLQIVTGQYPWPTANHVLQVCTALLRGDLQWPSVEDPQLDDLRSLMEECWLKAPPERPKMRDVKLQLEVLLLSSP